MMTRSPLLILTAFVSALLAYSSTSLSASDQPKAWHHYQLQAGDIVFQSGEVGQAVAIKAATRSRWSHVGLVFFERDTPWVLEAVQPVKTTPLAEFIARSPRSFYAMRLKDDKLRLDKKALVKAEQYARKQLGKPYDLHFRWSEKNMYCSELVWKVYKSALGLELCKPRRLSSCDLKHPAVQKLLRERYGRMDQVPMQEWMVAPSDLAKSSLLEEVPRRNSSPQAR